MILDGLRMCGLIAWRNQQIPVPIRRGRAIVGLRRADPYTIGLPDIFAIKPGTGVLIGIEVKTERGKQSFEQREWANKMAKEGALYVLARSWEDVVAGLGRVGLTLPK